MRTSNLTRKAPGAIPGLCLSQENANCHIGVFFFRILLGTGMPGRGRRSQEKLNARHRQECLFHIGRMRRQGMHTDSHGRRQNRIGDRGFTSHPIHPFSFGLWFLGRCPRLVWCRAVGAKSICISLCAFVPLPLCACFRFPLVPSALCLVPSFFVPSAFLLLHSAFSIMTALSRGLLNGKAKPSRMRLAPVSFWPLTVQRGWVPGLRLTSSTV